MEASDRVAPLSADEDSQAVEHGGHTKSDHPSRMLWPLYIGASISLAPIVVGVVTPIVLLTLAFALAFKAIFILVMFVPYVMLGSLIRYEQQRQTPFSEM